MKFKVYLEEALAILSVLLAQDGFRQHLPWKEHAHQGLAS